MIHQHVNIFKNAIMFLFSAMSVDIRVTYKAPPDFNFSSPPYYRPASSVSFMCVVNGASGSVHYEWSFRSGFTYYLESSITSYSLTAQNAGHYTCTVTDEDGSAVSASTEIILVGKCIILYSCC